MDNLNMIILKEMESIHEVMGGIMLDNDKKIKCMIKEPSHDWMANDIKKDIKMIKKKVMVNFSDRIEGIVKESERMENYMEKELLLVI